MRRLPILVVDRSTAGVFFAAQAREWRRDDCFGINLKGVGGRFRRGLERRKRRRNRSVSSDHSHCVVKYHARRDRVWFTGRAPGGLPGKEVVGIGVGRARFIAFFDISWPRSSKRSRVGGPSPAFDALAATGDTWCRRSAISGRSAGVSALPDSRQVGVGLDAASGSGARIVERSGARAGRPEMSVSNRSGPGRRSDRGPPASSAICDG